MRKVYRYPYCQIQITRLSEAIPDKKISTPKDAYEYWFSEVATRPDYNIDQEQLVVVMLNTKLKALSWHSITKGTVQSTESRIAEIIRPAIVMTATAILIMHNHPSGDVMPSDADNVITKRLNEACRIMGISLQDHLIVPAVQQTRVNYFSFRAADLI